MRYLCHVQNKIIHRDEESWNILWLHDGSNEGVAETIAARLGVASEDIHNVGTTKVDEVDKYDVLLLGSSTWESESCRMIGTISWIS